VQTKTLSPVHTGDKVEFNTVEFVESRQTWPCRFGPVHKVDCDKLSNSSCCQFAAKTGNKVNRIGNRQLCCRFVVGFGNSQLSTILTVLNSTLMPVCTRL